VTTDKASETKVKSSFFIILLFNTFEFSLYLGAKIHKKIMKDGLFFHQIAKYEQNPLSVFKT
jgi:hypothetical protein